MSFLSSLLTIFNTFTVNILSGFPYLPVTRINPGGLFPQMAKAINYVDPDGKFHLGQAFGSSSSLTKGTFTPAPDYKPGATTPPVVHPTFQSNGYVVPSGTNETSRYSLSSEGIRHIKYFEKLHQRPYILPNGNKNIGYGHYLSKDDKTTYISSDQADAFLAADIAKIEATVKSAISVKISQGQFDALVCLAYTMPSDVFKGSNVVSMMNGSDVAGACTAMMNWCYGKQNGIIALIPHLVAQRTFCAHMMTAAVDPQPAI